MTKGSFGKTPQIYFDNRKQQFLSIVKESLEKDSLSPILDIFTCIGPFYDLIENYNENDEHGFHRAWLFELNTNLYGEKIQIWIHDLGNSHSSYLCENTPEAMKLFYSLEDYIREKVHSTECLINEKLTNDEPMSMKVLRSFNTSHECNEFEEIVTLEKGFSLSNCLLKEYLLTDSSFDIECNKDLFKIVIFQLCSVSQSMSITITIDLQPKPLACAALPGHFFDNHG